MSIAQISHYAVLSLDMVLRQIRSLGKHRCARRAIKEDIFNSTVKYINKLKSMRPDVDVICGYEAGCLGYNLHRKLKAKEIESVILAPTTMAVSRNSSKKKNDYRDAVTIAKCLASSAYKAVYIPDEKDEDVRDFIRMRDDHKTALKQIKQQLNAFCLRHGHHYDKTKWTGLHLNWLRKLELSPTRDCRRVSCNL